MNILMLAAECIPFAKTGGLADVVYALSVALEKLGNTIKIILPRYRSIDRTNLKSLGALAVQMGNENLYCEVLKTNLNNTKIEVFFIEYNDFFDREKLYSYDDDFKRFSFFSKAALELCIEKIKWKPDILHCHDWHTAIGSVYLKHSGSKKIAGFENTKSVLTIHNLCFQGICSKDNFQYFGLDPDVFYKAGFEAGSNAFNILKAGITCADKITTVSKNYANETKTIKHGFGLEPVLKKRSTDYEGILNGIDSAEWDPSTDVYLQPEQRFSYADMKGKVKAKIALQKRFDLPIDANIPLIGMVMRLAEQKGIIELFKPGFGCAEAICRNMNVQMVILGTGEEWCEDEIRRLTDSVDIPNFQGITGYSEEIAHLIEAGSDLFLMPSRFEPCGLNQMYSLIRGVIPIVSRTGGLVDTVDDYNEADGSGTGFMFHKNSPSAIYNAVSRAIAVWENNPNHIEAMRLRGMQKTFNWEIPAKEYVALYKRMFI